MLGQKMKEHQVSIWMVNTGWTGGPFGTGSRIELHLTRAMISAALDDKLDDITYQTDPVFGLAIPTSCPGVQAEILDPRNTWTDKNAYDTAARTLAQLFITNFEKYAAGVDEETLAAVPKTA